MDLIEEELPLFKTLITSGQFVKTSGKNHGTLCQIVKTSRE